MKKSLLFFALLFIGYSNFFSQLNTYQPFPTTNDAQWEVKGWHDIRTGASYHRWKQYKVYGDTTIGSYTYKKVSVANNTGYPSWPNNIIPYGPSSFSFAYRNDVANKKVYYLNTAGGLNKDTLWYDFNLKIGDTIKGSFSNSHYSPNSIMNKVIQSISNTVICGTSYKVYTYCTGYAEGKLIEGVGFASNFVEGFTSNCPPFEPVELFYTTFSTCITTSIIKHDENNNIIHLYPNPVTTTLYIKEGLPMVNYTITNNLGELILQGNYSDKESINVSVISSGIYFLKIQDKLGQSYQAKFIKQ